MSSPGRTSSPSRRILICGTREYIPELNHKLHQIIDSLHKDDIIITGGYKGIDLEATVYAQKKGFTVEVFPADWKLGKKAGPIRNKKMIDSKIDYAYAFPYPTLEQSKGTYNCVQQLRERGIECEIFVKI